MNYSSQEPVEDLGLLLERAEELNEDMSTLLLHRPEYKNLVDAAQEAGMSREAVLMALRERLEETAREFKEGEFVFAESDDHHWYAAKYLGMEGSRCKLRYMTGGEALVEPTKLRAFGLNPGKKVQCYNATNKTWTSAEVIRYNPDSHSVTVNYWYTEEVLPIERIRIKRDFKGVNLNIKNKGLAIAIAIALGSGFLGALITMLLK